MPLLVRSSDADRMPTDGPLDGCATAAFVPECRWQAPPLSREWDIHLSQVETLEAPRRRGSDGTGARLSVGGPTSRPTRAYGCSRSSARIHADLSQMDNPLVE